jgi:hypothetical protein
MNGNCGVNQLCDPPTTLNLHRMGVFDRWFEGIGELTAPSATMDPDTYTDYTVLLLSAL